MLDSALLYNFVRDALGPYSEDFRIVDRHNPTILRLNQQTYSTHISYVHDSGNARDNDDEVRIQISRGLIERQRSRVDQGMQAAFLGFFPGGKTFVAWDPRHVFSLQAKTVVSVYARQSQLGGVEANLAAVHSFRARFLDENSLAIALPSSALGLYLENIDHFHRLPSEASVQRLIRDHTKALDDAGLGDNGEFEVTDEGVRERFIYERRAFPRDPRFKKAVLGAYERACCICNRQLALVQAAHIVPHSEEDSPNTVQNGLALCIEHHRLYDDALLLPGPRQTLIFNQERAAYLRETEQGRGLDDIAALEGRRYSIPADARLRPRDDYLERGVSIRVG